MCHCHRLIGIAFACATVVPLSAHLTIGDERQPVALTLQRRDTEGRLQEFRMELDPARTAIVVIDMWDRHWCRRYTERTGALVPRMNPTLAAARRLGIPVVFAPSDCLEFYRDAPQRLSMLAISDRPLPSLPPPTDFEPPAAPWSSTGGCECSADRPCRSRAAWTRQHPELQILEGDFIGDCNNGRELLAFCADRDIENLLYMGVASNMCVCGREFGIFNMTRHGKKCIVVRDLVEAISGNGYDPDKMQLDASLTPERGSQLVMAHLERYVAPSVDSGQVISLGSTKK